MTMLHVLLTPYKHRWLYAWLILSLGGLFGAPILVEAHEMSCTTIEYRVDAALIPEGAVGIQVITIPFDPNQKTGEVELSLPGMEGVICGGTGRYVVTAFFVDKDSNILDSTDVFFQVVVIEFLKKE